MAPFELFGRNFCLATLQHWLCVLLKPVFVPPARRDGTAPGRITCRTGTAGIEQGGGAERALVSIHYTAEESARLFEDKMAAQCC